MWLERDRGLGAGWDNGGITRDWVLLIDLMLASQSFLATLKAETKRGQKLPLVLVPSKSCCELIVYRH